MLGLFDQLGPAEIIIILAVFLLLFGAKKLPELARSLGRSSTEFRKGLKEGGRDADADESQAEAKDAPAPAPVVPPQNAAQESAVAESKPAETEKARKAE
jgi:sec-independent protein translocase protein TatA